MAYTVSCEIWTAPVTEELLGVVRVHDGDKFVHKIVFPTSRGIYNAEMETERRGRETVLMLEHLGHKVKPHSVGKARFCGEMTESYYVIA